MEVFVARHPIFDTQTRVYGYELEYRSDFERYYDALAANKATVDFMAFVNFSELSDGKPGLVHFSKNLVLKGFPTLFPSDSSIVDVPADMEPDEEITTLCKALRASGYSLAVSGVHPDRLASPLLEFANLARVDFRTTSAQEQAGVCGALRERGIATIAQGVATPDEFGTAVTSGYRLFQGDFFAKPVTREDNTIPANKMVYLKVLQEINRPELSYDDIAALVEKDVSMAYQLLRFMNSAWFGLRYEIRSVKHALVMLGPDEIRRWVSLVAVRNTGDDKPEELLLRGLTRARAAEQIAPLVRMDDRAPELFMMGLFSVIDALTDTPMPIVLKDLPLGTDITGALLGGGGGGAFRIVYDTILSYESGDWDLFAFSAAALKLKEPLVPPLFREARNWAKNALQN